MDKERVKGAINDAAGRAKRQVGEWTGDANAQVEGSLQQAKGKAQKAWGNIKDAAHDVSKEANRELGRQGEANRADEAGKNDREHAAQAHHHGT
jgi:uncharacterized protein YjbJ (UPF0337 family)